MKEIILLLVVAIAVAGCVSTPTGEVTSNSDDVTNATSVDRTGDDTSGSTPQTCSEAINYQVLVDAMPASVAGYISDEPEGNMLSFADPSTGQQMQYSMASATLSSDTGSISVSATDTCYAQLLSSAWLGFYEMEGTQGYLKKATIGGFPAWHQYEKSPNRYTYNVFVKDRVIVTVEGSSDVPDSDVEEAANAIDLGAISSAAE
jgi:uncharacterized protein YceK